MLRIRKSEDRGYADHGWLQSYHSFSFADYYDEDHMAWGNLRVINEDWIAAGKGFGKHGHRDMEIISYVLSGELAHQDSMGNVKSILPGEVQRMSAGRGVTHAEFNHAPDQTTHLLQIWITPKLTGIAPSYAQMLIPPANKRGRLGKIAAPDSSADSRADSSENAISINADAVVYAGLFDGDETAELSLDPARKAYVHLIVGELEVNGEHLRAGDALMLEHETHIALAKGKAAEVLVFDLAA